MKQRFEHRIRELGYGTSTREVIEEMEKDGWELTAVTASVRVHQKTLYFKRPFTEKND